MARSSASKSPKATTKSPPKETEPLLTQEAFEKELKALASKAQEETWIKWALEQLLVLTQSATLLTLAALYSNASQMALSPVYGGIPANMLHSKGIMSACFLGWSMNLYVRRLLPLKPKLLLPIIAAYVPVMQFFLFKISGTLGAKWGPIITEGVTVLPLVFLSVSCTATVLDDLDMNPGRMQWLSDAMPGITSFSFFKGIEYLSGNFLARTVGQSFLQTRIGLQVLVAGLYALFAPSTMLMFTIPAIIHTALFNPHVALPYSTASLNSTLIKNGWSLLDRHESITGYMSVIESAKNGFRVLRCDHSLLGGEWVAKFRGNVLPEPIYGVFVMLEAVRLIEVPHPVADKDAKALVIGLGIGTTPAAFITHGIATTIVEIDPVVHEFATKYFALPPNHTPVIADAVSYASSLAKTDDKYDYIVHDVFTGGAEPVDLFTLEFLQDLHSILKPGGVIAINYAGDLLLPPLRIIVRTIKSVFPTCRIYRESAPPSAATLAEEKQDFTNMVIFCTNSASQPVTFRKPNEKDFLGSRARRQFLLPLHEVDDAAMSVGGEEKEGEGGILRSNETERFVPWQQQSASGHWTVMRTVLPAQVWEQW